VHRSEKTWLPVRHSGRHRVARLALPVLLALAASTAQAQAQALQVLHWWKSASEHKAINVLAARLGDENIEWKNALIPGGSGVGASIVLKSLVLAGDAPQVAQLNGSTTLGEWADLGLLHEFDAVAEAGKWERLLHPTLMALVQPRGHVIAAPLGIHRINTLFYNRKLLAQLEIAPPQTWDEFERAAARLQQAGVVVLAQSSEPWQVGTLFETLVLAEGGAKFYGDLFVRKDARAFADRRLAHALTRLRTLKKWMAAPVQERPWTEIARQLVDGGAAMMVMGDFVKGELNAWGYPTDGVFGCSAAPDTGELFLYDVDTLVMLAGDSAHRRAQEKLAQVVMSAATQGDYNQIKGSIPALRNPDLAKMDSWSRASWKLFSRGAAVQVPSLTHRMATDEMTKDAMVATVHRFFVNDAISVAEAQRRLGLIAAATSRK
jgi:glucose/mannose transport system substrate-binding protein